jgi:uncharacterized protein (DUF2147 family)
MFPSCFSFSGVFTDYTEWYTKRGTDLNGAWKKDVNLGHSMAKTKYDWSGLQDAKKFESTNVDKFRAGVFGGKKAAAAPAKAAKPAFKNPFSK